MGQAQKSGGFKPSKDLRVLAVIESIARFISTLIV